MKEITQQIGTVERHGVSLPVTVKHKVKGDKAAYVGLVTDKLSLEDAITLVCGPGEDKDANLLGLLCKELDREAQSITSRVHREAKDGTPAIAPEDRANAYREAFANPTTRDLTPDPAKELAELSKSWKKEKATLSGDALAKRQAEVKARMVELHAQIAADLDI